MRKVSRNVKVQLEQAVEAHCSVEIIMAGRW